MSVTRLWAAEAREIQLYDWQGEAAEALRSNIRSGTKNQILVAPTGSGKTIIATYLIAEAAKKGKRAVFVCDRVNLIDQTSAVFDDYGLPHGVIQADHWRWRPWEKVQVASAQTLARRKWPEDVDLIIVDEAHTVHNSVSKRILERNCVTIGLSATPFTKGLGKLYDAVVTVRTLNQLTADGYLAPYTIYAATEPDMTGAKTAAGEWTIDEAADRAMPIIGDAVAEYLKHAAGKKFIAFGVNVAHCEEMQRQFMAAGVQCSLYTYQTGDEERTAMVREFRTADSYLRGLISVAALSKGFDVPGIEVIIMCRPLRISLAEHIQILGRGLRRDPDNPEKCCIVLDHAGNCIRFWQQMHDFFEHGSTQLDDGKRKEKKKNEPPEKEPYKCPRCAHVHPPRPMCPMCGHEYPRRNLVEHVPGELRALAAGTPSTVSNLRQDVYSQLLHVSDQRGYKEGYATHKFRELFGDWPNGLHKSPAPPTPKTLSWLKSQQIRWAKSRASR